MNIPPLSPDPIRAVTLERLRLLAIAYKITGIIGALMVSVLLIHVTMFTVLSFIPQSAWDSKGKSASQEQSSVAPEHELEAKKHDGPPVFIFRILAAVFFVVILIGWTLGALSFYAGKCIENREKKLFVMILAGWKCIWIPYGTLLGVSTFLILGTADAKAEYKD